MKIKPYVTALTLMLFSAAALAGAGLRVQGPAEVAAFRADSSAPEGALSESKTAAVSGRYGYALRNRMVGVVDTANPAVVARIPIGSAATGPMAAPPFGNAVYVATETSIAVIDVRSRTVVGLVPVRRTSHLVLNPDGSKLYALGEYTYFGRVTFRSLVTIDTRTRSVIATMPIPADGQVSSVALLPDGSKLYVARQFPGCCEGFVTVIDIGGARLAADIPLVVRGPLAASPDGRSVYAVTAQGIAAIGVQSNAVDGAIALSSVASWVVATAIAFDASGTFAYVSVSTSGPGFGGVDGHVLVVDTASLAIVGKIPVNLAPTAMLFDSAAARIYVYGQASGIVSRPTQLRPAGAIVIDASSRRVIANLPAPSTEPFIVTPAALVLNPTENAVYTLGPSSILRFDTRDYRLNPALPPASALVFSPDPPPVPGGPAHYVLRSSTNTWLYQPVSARGDVPVSADYDGDGRADFATLRPLEDNQQAVWHVNRSSGGAPVREQWGSTFFGDVPLPADYDGDGRADLAVWRPLFGDWQILRSSDRGFTIWRFGRESDLPVPADFDGDRRVDQAVYSDGLWQIFGSVVGVTETRLGSGLDLPVPGDYDGDGRAEAAVFDPINVRWIIAQAGSATPRIVQWGAAGDIPVPADFDGDRRTDIAIWRPSTGAWWIISSRTGGILSATWGAAGDRPEPADFDGDGKADLAVYRP